MLERRENIIVEKSEHFADRIVKMHQYLSSKKAGNSDILKQIVRSGTSIGANISESKFAQSEADFLTKMTISLKEANETVYWFEVISGLCGDYDEIKTLSQEASELRNLLQRIVHSIKNNS